MKKRPFRSNAVCVYTVVSLFVLTLLYWNQEVDLNEVLGDGTLNKDGFKLKELQYDKIQSEGLDVMVESVAHEDSENELILTDLVPDMDKQSCPPCVSPEEKVAECPPPSCGKSEADQSNMNSKSHYTWHPLVALSRPDLLEKGLLSRPSSSDFQNFEKLSSFDERGSMPTGEECRVATAKFHDWSPPKFDAYREEAKNHKIDEKLKNYVKVLQIPPIIFQTMESRIMPLRMAYVMSLWSSHHPSWEYRYFDAPTRWNFLQSLAEDFNGSPLFSVTGSEISEALSKLVRMDQSGGQQRLGVVVAELFRYSVVFVNGGAYFDADTRCKGDISSLLKEDDQMVFSFGNQPDQQVSQWGYAASPRHPILKLTFERAIRKILRHKEKDGIPSRIDKFVSMELMDATTKELLGVRSLQAGKEYSKGEVKVRMLPADKGEHWQGLVDFKYGGYEKDLRKCGIKHWHFGWGR